MKVMDFYINYTALSQWVGKSKEMTKLAKATVQASLYGAMDIIGQTAVSKYMVPAQVEWREKGKPKIRRTQRTKLNIMTGRLARSILNQYSYAQGAMGEKESIRKVRRSKGKFIAIIGSKVPYAAIHEFGGKYTHSNLFGKGIRAVINIPARPYLRPAAEDSKPMIEQLIQKRLDEFVKTVEKGK